MLIKGFENQPELLLKVVDATPEEVLELVSRVRPMTLEDDVLSYSLPGLPLCWKCTLKHTGQAVSFAAELEKYPERIACVVGELGHAYRECPDKHVAQQLHEAYQQILDTGCVPDFTEVLKSVVAGWKAYLHDSK